MGWYLGMHYMGLLGLGVAFLWSNKLSILEKLLNFYTWLRLGFNTITAIWVPSLTIDKVILHFQRLSLLSKSSHRVDVTEYLKGPIADGIVTKATFQEWLSEWPQYQKDLIAISIHYHFSDWNQKFIRLISFNNDGPSRELLPKYVNIQKDWTTNPVSYDIEAYIARDDAPCETAIFLEKNPCVLEFIYCSERGEADYFSRGKLYKLIHHVGSSSIEYVICLY